MHPREGLITSFLITRVLRLALTPSLTLTLTLFLTPNLTLILSLTLTLTRNIHIDINNWLTLR